MAWKSPSRPVMPCTISLVWLPTRTDMDDSAEEMDLRCEALNLDLFIPPRKDIILEGIPIPLRRWVCSWPWFGWQLGFQRPQAGEVVLLDGVQFQIPPLQAEVHEHGQ